MEISEDQANENTWAIYSDFAVARQSATRIGRDSRQGESAKLCSGKKGLLQVCPQWRQLA